MMTTVDNSGGQPEELAQEIKSIRYELKLTQRELADRLGVHPRSVSNWETGSVAPSQVTREQLRKLVETLQDSRVGNAESFSYYVMTYATHRPSGVLGTLRSLRRRIETISTELDQLIEELEQNSTTLPAHKTQERHKP